MDAIRLAELRLRYALERVLEPERERCAAALRRGVCPECPALEEAGERADSSPTHTTKDEPCAP